MTNNVKGCWCEKRLRQTSKNFFKHRTSNTIMTQAVQRKRNRHNILFKQNLLYITHKTEHTWQCETPASSLLQAEPPSHCKTPAGSLLQKEPASHCITPAGFLQAEPPSHCKTSADSLQAEPPSQWNIGWFSSSRTTFTMKQWLVLFKQNPLYTATPAGFLQEEPPSHCETLAGFLQAEPPSYWNIGWFSSSRTLFCFMLCNTSWFSSSRTYVTMRNNSRFSSHTTPLALWNISWFSWAEPPSPYVADPASNSKMPAGFLQAEPTWHWNTSWFSSSRDPFTLQQWTPAGFLQAEPTWHWNTSWFSWSRDPFTLQQWTPAGSLEAETPLRCNSEHQQVFFKQNLCNTSRLPSPEPTWHCETPAGSLQAEHTWQCETPAAYYLCVLILYSASLSVQENCPACKSCPVLHWASESGKI